MDIPFEITPYSIILSIFLLVIMTKLAIWLVKSQQIKLDERFELHRQLQFRQQNQQSHYANGLDAAIMDAIAKITECRQKFAASATADELLRYGKKTDQAVDQLIALTSQPTEEQKTDNIIEVNFR